jgi:lipopolysaccharide export system permease protein
MNTLDRYLYRTVLLYATMAMAVMLTLGALVLFITQQSDIGVGNYSAGDAFLNTLLNLPQTAFELLPIGAMIGALMGLGNLAAGSELVVTRASGVSVWRIAWPVGLAGLTLAVIMYGIGEYAAPPLAQYAKREKTTAKMADVSFAGSSSAWVKDGNLILHVQTGDADHAFGGVSVFELDGPTRLSSILRAARISVAPAGHTDAGHTDAGREDTGRNDAGRADSSRAYAGRWDLHDVATSRFGKDHVDADTRGEETMRSNVNPDFLGLAATDPQLLTLHGLASYIDHLRRNSLETAVFEIGFWSRIARLFAVIVVTLLALPFVFGPLRTTGAGTRTVIGVLLGVLFFLITRTVENGGQLFDLNPILVGWLPTFGVALCTIVAISRTR